MKDNLLHICFILDESGSMYNSVKDVIGGFNKLVKEQSKVKEGDCLISLFRFSDEVTESFIGKSINEITNLNYSPGGLTAMNDGIGTAIDKVGKWLSDMPENERPSKNMIVIMTDGNENASKKYTLDQVREKIQHQTDKYNWTFVYMGSDLDNFKDADNLGIAVRSLSSRTKIPDNYLKMSSYATAYRNSSTIEGRTSAENSLIKSLFKDTTDYVTETHANARNLDWKINN